jgi:hypothetical protein
MSYIEKDGYLIDPETGEVMGHAEEKPAFRVNDLPSCEWVLEKMQACDADIASLEMRRRAICANIDSQVAALRKRRQWLDMRFLSDLRAFAAEALLGSKSKTLTTPFGRLSFRRTPARIVVTDGDAAIAWAEREVPEAVKTVKSVLVSALKGREDLPRFAFETTDPEERFGVDTGVKGESDAA